MRAILLLALWALAAQASFISKPGGGGGSGTVTSVGLKTDSTSTSIFFNTANNINGSPITSAGNITLAFKNQSANTFWAGPTSGAATAPQFRLLTGADLPLPGASSLGGVQSVAAVSGNWIDSISTSGVPHLSQPAIADISGLTSALAGKEPTLTKGNLTSGTTGVSISGGTGAIIGSGASVSVQTASSSQPGLLSASDWTAFNRSRASRPPVRVYTTSTTQTTGSAVNYGGGALANGDRVLMGDNKVYHVTVSGGSVTAWTLDTDGQNGDGTPHDGDSLVVTDVNVSASSDGRWANDRLVYITSLGGWSSQVSIGNSQIFWGSQPVWQSSFTLRLDHTAFWFENGVMYSSDGGNNLNWAQDWSSESGNATTDATPTLISMKNGDLAHPPSNRPVILDEWVEALCTGGAGGCVTNTDRWTAHFEYHLFWNGSAWTTDKTTTVSEYKAAGASAWVYDHNSNYRPQVTGAASANIKWHVNRTWRTMGT